MSAIEVRNVSKIYPLSGSQLARMRRALNQGPRDGLWALRDVTFTVERGEAFGIIGANGSGKSTLLQIIAGILRPTSGIVEVHGRLAALLELGSGFSLEFSGRDNVYLNGSILGFSHEEMEHRFDAIERFAEIGEFIDQPVRTYSTGMVLRLAFAVAAHTDPEVLIVDEALAVGDIAFRQRCMHRIHELRDRSTTILFVSHESGDVKALCERCLWLEGGAIRMIGDPDEVVGRYLSSTLERERRESAAASLPAAASAGLISARHRFGDRRVAILSADLTGETGAPVRQLIPGARVVFRMQFRVDEDVHSLIAGMLVRNARGENIFGSNTARENTPVPPMIAGETHTVSFHWTAPELAPGAYTISPGLADGDTEQFEMCDYVEDAVTALVADHASGSRGYMRLASAGVTVHGL